MTQTPIQNKRIFMYGAPYEMNLGGPSIIHGLDEALCKRHPDIAITYLSTSRFKTVPYNPEPTYLGSGRIEYFHDPGISMREWTTFALTRRHNLPFKHHNLSTSRIFDRFSASDMVVSALGINFCDALIRSRVPMIPQLRSHKILLASRLLGKWTAHYTASYGPADKLITRLAAKALLRSKDCKILLCREKTSMRFLEGLGIQGDKLAYAPDTGLLMAPEPFPIPQYFKIKRPVVCISVSYQIQRQCGEPSRYVSHIAKLCDFLSQKLDKNILLIPNQMSGPKADDRNCAKEIISCVDEKDSVALFPSESFSSGQLKYVFSQCDFVISSRYHTLVAALSQGIPSIALGWHNKYSELLELYGQKDAYLSLQAWDINALFNQCNIIASRRDSLASQIFSHHNSAVTRILAAADFFHAQLEAGGWN